MMRIPTIQGLIERRILVNYRVRPAALERVLPPPFRPQTVAGYGVAGICLIRLSGVRPRWAPGFLGIGSENAAHRIAVEWDDAVGVQRGVYIPRRDTSSRFNAAAGGRLFPGEHHLARFEVRESSGLYQIEMQSADGAVRVGIRARAAGALPSGSVFQNLDEASAFFRGGSLGYSATTKPGRYHGLELRCGEWLVRPLDVEWTRSSFFENPAVFRPGDAEFDCALLMQNLRHEWHGRPDLCCPPVGALPAGAAESTVAAAS